MISVIVSTYNQPRELGFVLAALARQVRMPEEVWIADDGSDDSTRELVQKWQKGFPCRLEHVWHPDLGFRKAHILNEAVRRSEGEHLIFLDGDSFPHAAWVKDHADAANGRRVLCGRRVKLGPWLSDRLEESWIADGTFGVWNPLVLWSAMKGDTQRWALGVRLPRVLARTFHPRPRKLMGVNFSLPREAFYEVNGFDEAWRFYGREDRDLELRLQRAGWPFYPLLNRAIVYHVHHPERERSPDCDALIEAQERAGRTRCETGVCSSP